MRKYSVGLIVLMSVIFFPLMASGQLWLEDRQDKEGAGFKLGDSLVLHLGLGLEGGFDSNAMYTSDAVKAGRLRITPYVDIASRSKQRMEKKEGSVKLTPPKATFRFGLATYYDRYFAKQKDDVANLNSRFNPFGIDTHLDFSIFPQRKVTLLGGVVYVKTLEPYESSSQSQDRHQVAPTIGLKITPGGGTLEIEPRYRLNLLHFTDDAVASRSNKMSHDVSLNTSWKFLPKTALVSNILFSPQHYYGSSAENVDSLPIRSSIGLQTLLFNKFGFRALVGYGASFYQSGPDFDSVIADVALMFFLTPFSQITVGGKRDFVDSFYGNYYERNGGYASYQQMFAGRLLLTLKGSVFQRRYAEHDGDTVDPTTGNSTDVNTNNRSDVWITSSLLLEFRASDWLSFHMSGNLMADVTDYSVELNWTDGAGVANSEEYPGQFLKFEAFGGVRFHY